MGTKLITAAIVVIMIGVVIGVGYLIYQSGQPTDIPEKDKPAAGCPDSSATIGFSDVDKLSQGTTITGNQRVKVDGKAPADGTTSYAVGADLEILYNASGYNNIITTEVVPCGGTTFEGLIGRTANASLYTFNSDGNRVTVGVNGSTTTTNQTALGAGGSASLTTKLHGTENYVSGDLVAVVEITIGSEWDTPTWTGGGITPAEVPGFYSVTNAGGKAWAWNIPGIEDVGDGPESTLTIKAKSGQHACGNLNITLYSKQAYEDDDGTFKVGIEDSLDTAKWAAESVQGFVVDCD